MNEFPCIHKLPDMFIVSKKCHFNSRTPMFPKDIPRASPLDDSIGFDRSKNVTKHLIVNKSWNDSCPASVLYIGQLKLSMVYYYPTH
jgi:hypothetical protein